MSEPMFTLEIELGNEAMEETSHVANALREVADRLEGGFPEGGIRDLNGNTVGSYRIESNAE